MNLKLRFQNKTTCIAIVTLAVSFIYSILDMCGVVPSVSQNDILEALKRLIELMALLGIIVDPTTSGIGDSARALTYNQPKGVENIFDEFPVGGEEAGQTFLQHEENDPPEEE